MTQNIRISSHAYDQMVNRNLIPSKCPFPIARKIIYDYIKNTQPYKTLRSTTYFINNFEFVFANTRRELITFIVH
jgi:hypothetical protein